MAGLDPRTRAMLERTEQPNPEQREPMHGTLRDGNGQAGNNLELNPVENRAAGQSQAALVLGQRVRLRPKKVRGDIVNLALAGKPATIETVEEDVEGHRYVAVVMDDDPGSEFGLARMPGHRFYFTPDEIEPLDNAERRP